MKPLLLGMVNPLSDDPEFDLYPYPEGSAGHRLWKMLPEGTTRRQYLDAFDRLNLLRAREWSQPAAREAARALLPDLHGRTVVVLGAQVRAALGLPPAEPLSPQRASLPLGGSGDRLIQFDWLPVPHPSGRNLWYNDPEHRRHAGWVLAWYGGLASKEFVVEHTGPMPEAKITVEEIMDAYQFGGDRPAR